MHSTPCSLQAGNNRKFDVFYGQARVVYKMASSSDIRCLILVVVLSQVHSEVVPPPVPGHMQPLGSHRPMEGEIERIDYVPDPVTFYETYVREYKPIVMEGIVKDTVPLKKWTDEYLKYVSKLNKFLRLAANNNGNT